MSDPRDDEPRAQMMAGPTEPPLERSVAIEQDTSDTAEALKQRHEFLSQEISLATRRREEAIKLMEDLSKQITNMEHARTALEVAISEIERHLNPPATVGADAVNSLAT